MRSVRDWLSCKSHLTAHYPHDRSLTPSANSMDDDDTEMQVLSKAYIGRIAQIFQQSQHLSSASASAAGNADGDDRGFASAQAIAAMVSDGPTLGMSAGNAMSAEITEFLQGMEESERMLLRDGQEGARMIKEFMAGHH